MHAQTLACYPPHVAALHILCCAVAACSPGWGLAVFRMFFDALQLWLLVVSPAYGFNGWINPDNKWVPRFVCSYV